MSRFCMYDVCSAPDMEAMHKLVARKLVDRKLDERQMEPWLEGLRSTYTQDTQGGNGGGRAAQAVALVVAGIHRWSH